MGKVIHSQYNPPLIGYAFSSLQSARLVTLGESVPLNPNFWPQAEHWFKAGKLLTLVISL